MRHRQWIALLALCALALGAGYLLGRHAPAPATDTSAAAAPAFPAGSLPRMSNTSTTSPRSTPSVARTKTPLPPKDTPLKEAMGELRSRANAGDADAASRLAHDLHMCFRVSQLKQNLPKFMSFDLGDDDKKLSAEELSQRDKMLGYLQKDLDMVRDNEAFCAGLDSQDLETMLPALLRAAQLGSIAAVSCYLGAGVFGAPGVLNHPEWLVDYKQNAMPLVQSAFERGNWVVVGMLQQAYGGGFVQDLLSQLTGVDAAAEYRYLKLQLLGASGDFIAKLNKQIAPVAQGLTPEQIAEGDAWAQDAYSRYFNGSSSNELSNGVNLCNAINDE